LVVGAGRGPGCGSTAVYRRGG